MDESTSTVLINVFVFMDVFVGTGFVDGLVCTVLVDGFGSTV